MAERSSITTTVSDPTSLRLVNAAMGLAVPNSQVIEGPVCEHDPYPKYPSGNYLVRCFNAVIYRDPRFRAWKCRLECHFLTEEGRVCAFLNLGTGERPKVGRGSKYRRVWVMANGEQPRKRQVLSTRVFVNRIFRVRIADVQKKHTGQDHLDVERYSTIQDVYECIARP